MISQLVYLLSCNVLLDFIRFISELATFLEEALQKFEEYNQNYRQRMNTKL